MDDADDPMYVMNMAWNGTPRFRLPDSPLGDGEFEVEASMIAPWLRRQGREWLREEMAKSK